jgi:hypothetical protein
MVEQPFGALPNGLNTRFESRMVREGADDDAKRGDYFPKTDSRYRSPTDGFGQLERRPVDPTQ